METVDAPVSVIAQYAFGPVAELLLLQVSLALLLLPEPRKMSLYYDYKPMSTSVLAMRREILQQNGLHCFFTIPFSHDFHGKYPKLPFKGMLFSALLYVHEDSPECRICHGKSEVDPYIEICVLPVKGKFMATMKGAPTGKSSPFIDYKTIDEPKKGDHYWLQLKYVENNLFEGYYNRTLIRRNDPKKDPISHNQVEAVFLWKSPHSEKAYVREFHWTCPGSPGDSVFFPGKPVNPPQTADMSSGSLLVVTGMYSLNYTADPRITFTIKSKDKIYDIHLDVPANKTERHDITFDVHHGLLLCALGGKSTTLKTPDAVDTSTRIVAGKNFVVQNVIATSGFAFTPNRL